MRCSILNTIKRIICSLYNQNQFWFKLSKQHQLIRINFDLNYPNINQFTSNSLLTKINSLKINSIKINSHCRQTKHTLILLASTFLHFGQFVLDLKKIGNLFKNNSSYFKLIWYKLKKKLTFANLNIYCSSFFFVK